MPKIGDTFEFERHLVTVEATFADSAAKEPEKAKKQSCVIIRRIPFKPPATVEKNPQPTQIQHDVSIDNFLPINRPSISRKPTSPENPPWEQNLAQTRDDYIHCLHQHDRRDGNIFDPQHQTGRNVENMPLQQYFSEEKYFSSGDSDGERASHVDQQRKKLRHFNHGLGSCAEPVERFDGDWTDEKQSGKRFVDSRRREDGPPKKNRSGITNNVYVFLTKKLTTVQEVLDLIQGKSLDSDLDDDSVEIPDFSVV